MPVSRLASLGFATLMLPVSVSLANETNTPPSGTTNSGKGSESRNIEFELGKTRTDQGPGSMLVARERERQRCRALVDLEAQRACDELASRR